MPDDKAPARGGSALFSGFRVLGLYSNHVPHALRYHKKHREFYLVTAVGKCFHTYNVRTFADLPLYMCPWSGSSVLEMVVVVVVY